MRGIEGRLYIAHCDSMVSKNSIVECVVDDGSPCPEFRLVMGKMLRFEALKDSIFFS